MLNLADLIPTGTTMFGQSIEGASCGLFEVSVGKNGISSRIGTGGTDVSFGTLRAAAAGLKESNKIVSWKYGDTEKRSTLNSINMLGWTDNDNNRSLSKEIWDEKKKVLYEDLGADRGNYEDGDDTIYINKSFLGDGKKTSAKLAAVLAHEGSHVYGNKFEALAHVSGLQTYEKINELFNLETDSSFAGEMVKGILNLKNWEENRETVNYWENETYDSSITEEQYNSSWHLQSKMSWEEVQNYFSEHPNGILHKPADEFAFHELESRKDIIDPNACNVALVDIVLIGREVGKFLADSITKKIGSATAKKAAKESGSVVKSAEKQIAKYGDDGLAKATKGVGKVNQTASSATKSPGVRNTPDQQALRELADEAVTRSKKGNPISFDDAKILDDWASEYNVPQHHKAYKGSGTHWKTGQDHTHIYNMHVPFTD